ncbi:11108_t:CDS:1 [Ambispora gerdemannii]|uniref:11108_t:CDS:1 n=1 Tax=Ambispora gerdemannii TaxID=144530 RepID=A0A9N9G205_9GLOM|nr:11108_t:CDS:1 [Ambispora gerdemannii]
MESQLYAIQKASPSSLSPSKHSPKRFLLIILTVILTASIFFVLIFGTSNDNKKIRSVGYFPVGTGRLSISYPVTGSVRLYHQKRSSSSPRESLSSSSYDTIFLMGYLKGIEKLEGDYSFLVVSGNGCQDWQETIYDLTDEITSLLALNYGSGGGGLSVIKATTMAKFSGTGGLTVGNFFMVLRDSYPIGCGAIERI